MLSPRATVLLIPFGAMLWDLFCGQFGWGGTIELLPMSSTTFGMILLF